MNIIYSGFDTIDFAVMGALSCEAVERMHSFKKRAEKEDQEILYTADGLDCPVMISGHGRRGGYAFALNTGPAGCIIVFKKNLSQNEWNGFVSVRAMSLATRGWQEAIQDALSTLSKLGFSMRDISMNRVDYCMDFLNPDVILDPKNFIVHSHVTKASHSKLSPRGKRTVTLNINDNDHAVDFKPSYSHQSHNNDATEDCMIMITRGERAQSITLGKMPGRQVIAYDKRAEVITKRKYEWFKIWNIERADSSQSVLRIELRAGKKELQKFGVRSLKDFEASIGDVFVKAVKAIRYVERTITDTNITRLPLQPLWINVQSHVEEHLFDHVSGISLAEVKQVWKDEKAREYLTQALGNLAGYAVCTDTTLDKIPEVVSKKIREDLETAIHDNHPFGKTYVRAKERLVFF